MSYSIFLVRCSSSSSGLKAGVLDVGPELGYPLWKRKEQPVMWYKSIHTVSGYIICSVLNFILHSVLNFLFFFFLRPKGFKEVNTLLNVMKMDSEEHPVKYYISS